MQSRLTCRVPPAASPPAVPQASAHAHADRGMTGEDWRPTSGKPRKSQCSRDEVASGMLPAMPYREHLDDPVLERWILRFGVAMRAARRGVSLSQDGLATRSLVNQSSISRLEAGRTPNMSLVRLGRISIGMGGRVPIWPCPHPHECAFGKPLITEAEAHAYRLRRQFMAQGVLDPRLLDQLVVLPRHDTAR